MSVETKVTEANQTQVPADIRAKFGVEPGDLLVWEESDQGDVRVRFRHRRELGDLVGLIHGGRGGDAVRDKKRAQRGEL